MIKQIVRVFLIQLKNTVHHIYPKDTDTYANSVDPDQSAPK